MSREEQIQYLLARNVEEVIQKDHLAKALQSGKRLRVKLGIDPTSPDLHLGHAVILRKLKEFQGLGHKIVLIIGDFTARIGDPSGRSKERPSLAEKEIKKNEKDYLMQAGKILDIKKSEVRHNSEWLAKLKGGDLLKLMSMVSMQQILERKDFSERIQKHTSIRLHEVLYPVLQAYDSVMVKSNVELGGTDQTFNLLAGRTLMERFGMEPQDVLITPLLEGMDGVKKMSKSEGNYIGLMDSPDEMFGKIMSLSDSLMEKYFFLATELTEKEVKDTERMSPRNRKARLGFEVVKLYHGEKKARDAEEQFTRVFSKKQTPNDATPLKLAGKNVTSVDAVMEARAAESKSEARRLVLQGAVKVNDIVKKDPNERFSLSHGDIVKIGKHRFFKVQ